MDALSALRKGRNTEAGPKKNSVPQIAAPASISEPIKNWLKANQAKKTAEAELADAFALIEPEATKLRIEHSKKAGAIQACIKIVTTGDGGQKAAIKFTQVARLSKMLSGDNDENVKKIKAEFGEDFDKFFKISDVFSFKPEDFTQAELEKIVKALGPSGIEKIIPERQIVAKEDFFSAITLNDKMREKCERLQSNHGLCKQFSPSIQNG